MSRVITDPDTKTPTPKANASWGWIHSALNGGIAGTSDSVDGYFQYPVISSTQGTAVGTVPITVKYGMETITGYEAPGWLTFWRQSVKDVGASMLVSHLVKYKEPAVANTTPSQEQHFIFAYGAGDMTSTGTNFLDSYAYCYYALSLSAAGMITLWRKNVNGLRTKLIESYAPITVTDWNVMQLQISPIPSVDGIGNDGVALRGLIYPQSGYAPSEWTIQYDDLTSFAWQRPTSGGTVGYLHLRTSNDSSCPMWKVKQYSVSSVAQNPLREIAFTRQPSGAPSGIVLPTQPVVSGLNSSGSPEPSFNSIVQLTLVDNSEVPIDDQTIMVGARTVSAIAGSSSYSGLSITDTDGGTYKLVATTTSNSVNYRCVSDAFVVTATGSTNGFGCLQTFVGTGTASVSTASVATGAKVAAITVKAYSDEAGTTLNTGFCGRVDLSVRSGPSSGILSGKTRIQADGVTGSAVFDDITANKAGTYVLEFTSASMVTAVFTLTVTSDPYVYGNTVEDVWIVAKGEDYDGQVDYPTQIPWRIDNHRLAVPPIQCEITDNPIYTPHTTLSLSRINTVEGMDYSHRRTAMKQITITMPRSGRELYDILDIKRKFSIPFYFEVGGLRDGFNEAAWTPHTDADPDAGYKYYGLERSWKPGSLKVYVNGTEVTTGFSVDHEHGYIVFDTKKRHTDLVTNQTPSVTYPADIITLDYVWRPRVEVVSITENLAARNGLDIIMQMQFVLKEVG